MISKPAYAGFEWPVWDTDTGRLMESSTSSPFADPGDNTAIYMLTDPRTGRVRYISGQSVSPSDVLTSISRSGQTRGRHILRRPGLAICSRGRLSGDARF